MGLEGILTVAISVTALLVSVFTYTKSVVHDRKRDTLDAYNVLQEQALDILNEYTAAEISSVIDGGDKEEYRKLSKCLARLEHFSVGVNTGIYDKKTVYQLSHGYLDIGIWYKLQPVLEQKQKGKKEDFYKNYRQLVSWMLEQSGNKS